MPNPPSRLLALAIAVLGLLGPLGTTAHAQFDAQTFRPDPDGLGTLGVSSSRTLSPGLLSLGIFGNYAIDPVVADLPSGSQDVTTDLATIDLLAAIGLTESWEVGLDLPLSVVRNVAFAEDVDQFTFGLGDVSLFTKWAPLSRDRGPVGLALDLSLGLPTGDEGNFLGAEGVTVDAGVLADGDMGPVAAAARLAYLFRDSDAGLGDALGFAVALSYEGDDNAFQPIVELSGSSAFDDFGTEEASPLEALVGFRWELPMQGLAARGGPMRGLVLRGGVGFGLTDGIGSPTARGVLGLSALTGPAPAAPRPIRVRAAERPTAGGLPDGDGDGVPDHLDLCAGRAEDRDGHLDLDGCPDAGGPPPAPVLRTEPVAEAASVAPAPRAPEPEFVPTPAPVSAAPSVPVGSGPVERFAPIRFASSGSGLSPEGARELERLRRVLLADPSLVVRLIGHADGSGPAERNVLLSIDRAAGIEDRLVAGGIERRRIEALGVGDVAPVATNATPEGRALNRRVEIQLERR